VEFDSRIFSVTLSFPLRAHGLRLGSSVLEHRQTRDARRVASSPDGRARFGALPETLRALLTFGSLSLNLW
jgi:hypothetical protein